MFQLIAWQGRSREREGEREREVEVEREVEREGGGEREREKEVERERERGRSRERERLCVCVHVSVPRIKPQIMANTHTRTQARVCTTYCSIALSTIRHDNENVDWRMSRKGDDIV